MLNLFFMLGLPEIFCCCFGGLSGWLAGAMIARNSPRLLSKIVISFLDLFFPKKRTHWIFLLPKCPPHSFQRQSLVLRSTLYLFFLSFFLSTRVKTEKIIFSYFLSFARFLFHDVGWWCGGGGGEDSLGTLWTGNGGTSVVKMKKKKNEKKLEIVCSVFLHFLSSFF